MKKILILSLFLTGCSTFRYATVDKNGQIVNEHNVKLTIVGNPLMTCSGSNVEQVVGYFMYQMDDGSFKIDSIYTGAIIVKNPICRLGY